MNNIKSFFNSGKAIFFLMVFICCVIGSAVLKIAAVVILPFTIAVLLAFVVYPIVKGLDKRNCPHILSVVLIILLIIAGFSIFGAVFFTSGRMIVVRFPQYEDRIKALYDWAADLFLLPNDEALSIWQNLWEQAAIRSFVRDFTLSFSNTLFQFVSSAILVMVFLGFILFEASYFKEKLENAFESRSVRINKMGIDLMSQVTRYLAAKFFISLVNGVIFALGFHLVGLDFAILWGVLQFLLNFIPNLGSILSGIIISLFALIQFWPNPVPIIMVISVILAVNLFVSGIFDPKIVGDHVGISPLVVLVSLAIWGWIWGFTGMVIAVPMTVIIKIVCENVPIMEPVSILLGTRKSIRARKAERERLK